MALSEYTKRREKYGRENEKTCQTGISKLGKWACEEREKGS
jgi:hypothetical protein